MKIWLGLAACVLIGGCAPRPASRVKPAQAEKAMMRSLPETDNAQLNALVQKIAAQVVAAKKLLEKNDASAAAALQDLSTMYSQLKRELLRRPHSDLSRQYCDIVIGVLADVDAQFSKKFHAKAQESFARVESLQADLNATIR